jgi:hypothetical protein
MIFKDSLLKQRGNDGTFFKSESHNLLLTIIRQKPAIWCYAPPKSFILSAARKLRPVNGFEQFVTKNKHGDTNQPPTSLDISASNDTVE